MWRGNLAVLAVALLGAAVLWWGTDGGQALTTETARRLDIATSPRVLPDVVFTDQNGADNSLSDYHGTPLLMEFIYTRCPDICQTLGTTFEQLDNTAPDRVHLLSISFDPTDKAEQLGWFAERHNANPPRWRIVRVKGDAARAALLKRAGVVVIPDGMGGFVHNAGLYLVNPQGKLTHIFNPDDAEGALAALQTYAP